MEFTEKEKTIAELFVANLNAKIKTIKKSKSAKEEVQEDEVEIPLEKNLQEKMDDFLVKLPTVRTQTDGFINTSSGDFGFPLQLRVAIDENGQEYATAVEKDTNSGVASISFDSMEME